MRGDGQGGGLVQEGRGQEGRGWARARENSRPLAREMAVVFAGGLEEVVNAAGAKARREELAGLGRRGKRQ